MKRWLAVIIAVVIFCVGIGACRGCEAKPVDKALKSSVSIEIIRFGRWSIVGSGTVVDTKIGTGILTAKHVAVVPGFKRACNILVPDECQLLGPYVSSSAFWMEEDWALYKAHWMVPKMRPAKVSHKMLDIGDPIFAVGHPQRMHWVSHGHIGWKYELLGRSSYGLDSFVFPGSSGGGLFNKKGELIGIVTALFSGRTFTGGPRMMEDQGYAISINNVDVL